MYEAVKKTVELLGTRGKREDPEMCENADMCAPTYLLMNTVHTIHVKE